MPGRHRPPAAPTPPKEAQVPEDRLTFNAEQVITCGWAVLLRLRFAWYVAEGRGSPLVGELGVGQLELAFGLVCGQCR